MIPYELEDQVIEDEQVYMDIEVEPLPRGPVLRGDPVAEFIKYE
jgi:hypothetical protein